MSSRGSRKRSIRHAEFFARWALGEFVDQWEIQAAILRGDREAAVPINPKDRLHIVWRDSRRRGQVGYHDTADTLCRKTALLDMYQPVDDLLELAVTCPACIDAASWLVRDRDQRQGAKD